MTSSRKNGLNIRTNASPKLDRARCPEERPLLASRIRCNVLPKSVHNLSGVLYGILRSFKVSFLFSSVI